MGQCHPDTFRLASDPSSVRNSEINPGHGCLAAPRFGFVGATEKSSGSRATRHHRQPGFYYAAPPAIPHSEVTVRIFAHEGWQIRDDVCVSGRS